VKKESESQQTQEPMHKQHTETWTVSMLNYCGDILCHCSFTV